MGEETFKAAGHAQVHSAWWDAPGPFGSARSSPGLSSPAGSLKDDSGTGASDGQGEAEGAGEVSLARRRLGMSHPRVSIPDGGCEEDGARLCSDRARGVGVNSLQRSLPASAVL